MKPRIVVVDGFYDNPEERRNAAFASGMKPHPDYHKGIRSDAFDIPEPHRSIFERFLGGKMKGGYACFQACVSSDLLVYHSDTQDWAAIIYLTPEPPPESGTSFFRSKHTRVRHASEVSSTEIEAMTYGGKLLDRTAWEEIDRTGNIYNRLVIWDAKLVHAATNYFGTSPENGRLFEMFFFDMEPQ